MKLLVTILTLLPLVAFSQTDSLYVYAELQPGTSLANSMTVYVNYPKSLKDHEPNTLRDKSGMKITFRSLSGALTLMAADGWEYVDNYTLGAGARAKKSFIIRKKFHASQVENPMADE